MTETNNRMNHRIILQRLLEAPGPGQIPVHIEPFGTPADYVTACHAVRADGQWAPVATPEEAAVTYRAVIIAPDLDGEPRVGRDDSMLLHLHLTLAHWEARSVSLPLHVRISGTGEADLRVRLSGEAAGTLDEDDLTELLYAAVAHELDDAESEWEHYLRLRQTALAAVYDREKQFIGRLQDHLAQFDDWLPFPDHPVEFTVDHPQGRFAVTYHPAGPKPEPEP